MSVMGLCWVVRDGFLSWSDGAVERLWVVVV